MKKTLLATAVALAFICQGALASTYNFVQLIDGPASPGTTFSGILADGSASPGTTPTGEDGYQSASWTVDGRTITLTSSDAMNIGESNYSGEFVYFDGGSAGVGICPAVNSGNQCTPSSDDNVKVGEKLKASFAGAVDVAVDALVFRKANHALVSDNSTLTDVLVSVNGAAAQTIASLVGTVLNGSMFEFHTTDNTQQFYLSSLTATPLPAAFLLFGAGLLGLFGAGRARSNKSS